MVEESKILESLVRRQVRFNKAIAELKGITTKPEYVQLTLSGLKVKEKVKETTNEIKEVVS